MTYVTSLFAAFHGGLLSIMGYGPSTWQFWCVMACYIIPNAIWMCLDWRRSRD